VDPPCPEECNCLKVCHINLKSSDSRAVGPCGKQGTLNVMSSEFPHDFCACGDNTPTWSVVCYDDGKEISPNVFRPNIFNSVTITRAGSLKWVTQGAEILDRGYGEIILKVCCGELDYYINVIIFIKDLCNCPTCNDCELCDPCNGDCIEPDINLIFKTVPTSANTILNVNS
jgi:hypothetical protein